MSQPPVPSMRAERIAWVVLVTSLVWLFVAALWGLASPWEWGHNGFNGAAFSQAARNSLRFGMVAQAPYWVGLGPPPVAELYTHHPLLIHAHLVALYAWLGDAPWVGRLVPALYTILAGILVARIAWRWHGALGAAVAAAVFATTPLNLIYANMIDHEQGSLFWNALALYAYVRWLDTKTHWRAVLSVLAFTCALNFDWPSYFVAFVVFVHALTSGGVRVRALGIGDAAPSPRWTAQWTYALVLALVTLAGAALFFAWAAEVQGSLADLRRALTHRSADIDGYAWHLFSRSLDLHGPLLMAGALAWLVDLFVRARRGLLVRWDLVPVAFAVAQLVHSVVFKNAGSIHAYWLYHASPAVALGFADVVMRRGRAFCAGSGALSSHRRLQLAVAMLALAATAQTIFAVRQLAWGRATGAASYAYASGDDNQRAEQRLFEALHQEHPRGTRDFLLHQSVQRPRIELASTLDAPWRVVQGLSVRELTGTPRPGVVIVDLAHASLTQLLRAELERLTATHPTTLWSERFVTFDLASDSPTFVHRVRVAVARPWCWTWLVDPHEAPAEWASLEAPGSFAEWLGTHVDPEAVGGKGGGVFARSCPPDMQLIALEVCSTVSGRGEVVIASVGGECCDAASCVPLPGIGVATGARCATLRCAEGQAPTGLSVEGKDVVQRVELVCAAPAPLACPKGMRLTGLHGRLGALIDALGPRCAVPTTPALSAVPTSPAPSTVTP